MKYQLVSTRRILLPKGKFRFEWIERVLTSPTRWMPDRRDAALEHLLGAIEEFDERVLRVVVNRTAVPVRVVTVYFDRTMKGKL